MNFIIPQNYNFKNKLLGFMDYSTAIVNVIWSLIVFMLVKIFPITLNIKIGLFITLCFPLLLFSFFRFQQRKYYLCFIIYF